MHAKHLCIPAFFLFMSCNGVKKTNTVESPVSSANSSVPDTVKTVEPAFAKPYRASAPRSNDLLHTRLEVEFDWANCRMKGTANLQLKPYFLPVSKLYLNARGMDIQSVEVFTSEKSKVLKKVGTKESEVWVENIIKLQSTFMYQNDSIKIDLGREFSATEVYSVDISYVAKPNELGKSGGSTAITDDKGLYFINPTGENPYKMPQIWTQGETQASSVWFPTIDNPNERGTQEIFITVEDRLVTLSNGVLVDSKKLADGRRTDHWQLNEPHAPYLAMMAVGTFKKVLDTPWRGKEVAYYVDAEYEPYAKAIFGDTPEMLEFFSNKLGVPFAWPKYAQVVARDYVSGAMENTSATLHGDFMVYQTEREMVDGKKGTDVISHELFHQWFGDLVTCESWSNLPLNESFATYGEYLWQEYKYGRTAADEHAWQSRQGYMMGEKDEVPIRFDYRDKEDMFDAISYNKGGQILHMLRKATGDDVFFAALKNYLTTNQFKAVEIHHLRLAFEEVSGQDLNWFFNQWFLSKGRPNLSFQVSDLKNGTIRITSEQKQNLSEMPLYRLPLAVDVYTGNKATRSHITLQNQRDTFYLSHNGNLQFVNIDAERQLLADIEYSKPKEQYLLQYKLAPLFLDRLEALSKLENDLTDNNVYQLFINAAKNDSSVAIRRMALTRLEKTPADKTNDLKQQLVGIFNADKNTTVRARALSVLNKKFSGEADLIALNGGALREQSPAICAEALYYLAKNDGDNALDYAKRFEKENSVSLLLPVASIYAERGTEQQLAFFHNALRYFGGFDLMSFVGIYGKTIKKFSDPTMAIIAAEDFEQVGKGANRFVKHVAAKSLKDLAAVWEGKAQTFTREIEAAKSAGKDVSSLEPKAKEARETAEIIKKRIDNVK